MDYGKAVRAYCYVTDAVEIMWNILLQGKEAIYNVGGVDPKTIANIAETIGNIMKVPVVFPDTPDEVNGSPERSYLDMSKVQKEFGKTKYVSIKEGLRHWR